MFQFALILTQKRIDNFFIIKKLYIQKYETILPESLFNAQQMDALLIFLMPFKTVRSLSETLLFKILGFKLSKSNLQIGIFKTRTSSNSKAASSTFPNSLGKQARRSENRGHGP